MPLISIERDRWGVLPNSLKPRSGCPYAGKTMLDVLPIGLNVRGFHHHGIPTREQ